MKKTEEQFIKDSKEKFGDRFDYSKCKYTGSKEKITLICKKHGSFWMLPYNFYGNYQDCPRCFESKAEKEIENFLISKNIAYKHQMSFPDLKDERKLFYDFYLEKQNLLIECQGEQHYKPVEYFGGEEKFKLQKYHDKLKKEYSLKHNYNFLEIPYWEKDVVGFLINKINI